jgi:phage shock protein C
MNDQYRDGSKPFGGTEDSRASTARSGDDLSEAVKRFEKAVEGLALSARDQFGDRAARFINEATSRIEREAGRQSRRQERRERRRQRRGNVPEMWLEEPAFEVDEMGTAAQRSGSARRENNRGRWYRDRQRRKIAGVCSGLARYFGVQTWVVRGATITGALFFPTLVIPAYFIAMLALPESARNGVDAAPSSRSFASVSQPSGNGEEQPRSVRRDFRDTQALLSQAELRLRRMEAHVTSDQYELQKELHRLEHGGSHGGSVA